MDKSKIKDNILFQFFVRRSGLLGSTRHLIAITNDSLILNSLPLDAKNQEILHFSKINSIEVSDRNQTDFTLTTATQTTYTFMSAQRSFLVCEIYQALDKYNMNSDEEASFPTCNARKMLIPGNEDIFIDVKLVIYSAHLELTHEKIQGPEEVLKEYFSVEKNNQLKVGNTTKILFSSISTMYKTNVGFVIELRDSGVTHSLILHDLEKSNWIIADVSKKCKENLGFKLDVNDHDYFKGLPKDVLRPEDQKDFLFIIKVYKLYETGTLCPMEIALSDTELIEIDIASRLIIQRYYIGNLLDIVRMNVGLPGIQIIFDDLATLTYIPPSQLRGLVLSNIYTVANWKRSSEYSIQQDMIFSLTPNYFQKTFGWDANGVDLDYEIYLIKRFSNPTDDDSFYRYLREFNMNATLTKFTDNEPKPLQFLMQLFMKKSKIIFSNEFIAFWELYQQYLNNSHNFDFGESKLSDDHHKLLLKSYEEKLKHMITKFQYDDKSATIELNAKTLPVILSRTEELLKGIIILISSKSLFREIVTNKKETEFYQEFLMDVAMLIDSPFPTLSHLAGCLFRGFCRYASNTEKKIEAQNKHFVLTKIDLMKIVTENLAKKALVKKKDQKEFENAYILSILASMRILKTFIYERKETTSPEDMQIILKYLQTPYFFAIFNFLSRYRSIPCIYNTTILINAIFQSCSSREKYKEFQNKILNNSSLMLLHITLAFSSISEFQKRISIILLSNLFVDNANCCALICRIFPKNLFRKVEASTNDISKWGLENWEKFFALVSENFDTPTEQWTDSCRQELQKRLISVDRDINSKFVHCPPNRLNELFDPNAINPGEFLLGIRWNHEEMEMKYDVLQDKLLVWKYYLKSLLQDGEKPRLNCHVSHAVKFWNELNVKFIATTDISEMMTILKVMILLYAQHFSLIRDLNTMHFWLKCLKKDEYIPCRYLILQLLYTSFTVEDQMTTRFNIKKFVDSNGLLALADTLGSLYFSEDHNDIDDMMDDLRANNENITYNYTSLSLPYQAYSPSLEKSCMILYILNIYKAILQRPQEKNIEPEEKLLYPIQTAKYQIIEESTIKSLLNVLLLHDDALVSEILEFFINHLCDKFTFKSLAYKTPLYEFLLYNINSSTATLRFTLISKLYNKIAEETSHEENHIKAYTDFSFDLIKIEVIEQALKTFPLLRYFPKHFIWKLINEGVDSFKEKYWSDSFEIPQLIWNGFMRQTLSHAIEMHVQEYRNEIVHFGEENQLCTRKQIPAFLRGSAEVVYHNLLEEVQCGPVYLRVWIMKSFRDFSLSSQMVPIFVQNIYGLLKKYLDSKRGNELTEDLLIILKGHAKTIKSYSLKKYECYNEIAKVMTMVLDQVQNWSYDKLPERETLILLSELLMTISKIIYRSLVLENSENHNTFTKTGGFILIRSFLSVVIQKVIPSQQKAKSYYDCNPSFVDIKTLDLIERSLKVLLIKVPDLLEGMITEERLKFFYDLQQASKIPLALFEKIRLQKEVRRSLTKEYFDDEEDEDFDSDDENEKRHPAIVSIFDVISKDPDSSHSDTYLLRLFQFTKNQTDLFLKLSSDILSLMPLVQTGVVWRLLEYYMYYVSRANYSERVDEVNFQNMLEAIERAAFILRNILIFSNEIYTIKLTIPTNGQKQIGIFTSREKSSQLVMILSKLEPNERIVISKFHETAINLIGKKLVQKILTDYYEPIVVPEDKDQTYILGFLNLYANNIKDPSTVWTEETKIELRQLTQSQISEVNSTYGKNYINLCENFVYTAHKSHLIIDEIFITLYNQDPKFVIPNPPQFLLKALKRVEEIRIASEEVNKNITCKEDSIKLNNLLTDLCDAMNAVSNVIAYHGFEDVILYEENLTQIGHLLEDPLFKNEEDESGANLRSIVLDILVTLSNKLNGALKIIENVTIMKWIIVMIRSNLKKVSDLINKIFKIFSNIAKYDNLKNPMINYGILVLLWESVLKAEIYSHEARVEVFGFLIRILKSLDVTHPIHQLVLFFFPPSIQELLYSSLNPSEIVTILDNGYDTPNIIWTKFMRHEILMTLEKECDLIQNKWEAFKSSEIRIMESVIFWDDLVNKMAPKFPEIHENICINNIYLKNLNINASLDQNVSLLVFIDDVASRGLKIFEDYVEKLNLKSAEQTKLKTRIEHELITIMTSLLLLCDKLMCQIKQKAAEAAIKVFRASISINEQNDTSELVTESQDEIDSPKNPIDERFIFSEDALTFVSKCFDLFDRFDAHPSLYTLSLQLMFVVADHPRGLSILKTHDIIHLLSKILKNIVKPKDKYIFNHVDERLVLILILKLMGKEQKLLFEVYDQCLQPLCQLIQGGKTYLFQDIKNALAILIQDIDKGRKAYEAVNETKQFITTEEVELTDSDAVLEQIWKKNFNPGLHSNFIEKIANLNEKIPDYPIIPEVSCKGLDYLNQENVDLLRHIEEFVNLKLHNYIL